MSMVVPGTASHVLSVNWIMRVSLRPPTAVFGSVEPAQDSMKLSMEDFGSPISIRIYHTEERPNGRISRVSFVHVLSMPMEYAAPSGNGE